MANKSKALICGDVESNFDAIFDKVRNLNKKSPFAFLLCVGNFFSNNGDIEALEKYKTGTKSVPIPTYILGPNTKEQDDIYNKLNIDETNNEICPNLSYLGRKGVYTLSSKFTLAYLSGTEVKEGDTKEPWQFDKKDVIALRNSALKNFSNIDDFRGIDFLLTSQWAAGVGEDAKPSKLVSFLSLNIKPRYHFCALNDVHFEKQPFRMPAANARSIEPVSRFIALAKVNNPAKSKFLYAMNVQPLSEMRLTELMMKSTDEIECPYITMDFTANVKEDGKESSNAQFFWGVPGDHQNNEGRKRRYDDQQQNKRFKPMVDQEKCWFCLQSQDIEKHLIISIGDHFYLALAKNPVCSYHVLIIPVSHIQAVSHLTDELFKELEIFKKSIKKFFETVNMTAVFFERNYAASHCIVNAVGIPQEIEWQLPETLKDKAEDNSLTFETIPKVESPKDLPEKGAYFIVEFGKETQITRSMKHFPINFGRDFVCAETLLNAEDKVDWKNCKLPKHIEEEHVSKFKEAYKPYDFNVADDDSD